MSSLQVYIRAAVSRCCADQKSSTQPAERWQFGWFSLQSSWDNTAPLNYYGFLEKNPIHLFIKIKCFLKGTINDLSTYLHFFFFWKK